MELQPDSPLPESNEALADEIRTLAAYLTAATHRMLTLLRELDRRTAWAEPGFHTCAHWLSYYTGLNMNSAREKVRVARALADLPLIDEAFRTARVSYSKRERSSFSGTTTACSWSGDALTPSTER